MSFQSAQPSTTYARFVKTEDNRLVISVYRGKDKSGNAIHEHYASFVGYFRGIKHRPAPKDKPDLRPAFQFLFDGTDGQSVTFEVAEDASYGHKIIASLGSATPITLCRLSPYMSENKDKPSMPYYNVAVRDITMDDSRNAPFLPFCIDFKEDLPPVERVMYKGKEMIDNSNRVEYFKKLAAQIDTKITAQVRYGTDRSSFTTASQQHEQFEKAEGRPSVGESLYAAPSPQVPRNTQVVESDDELPF